MTTRSSRLWYADMVGRPSGLVYQVPAATVVILKSIYWDVSEVPNDVIFTAVVSGGGSVYVAEYKLTTDQLASSSWSGWMVLHPADEVHAYAQVGELRSWGSGALLPQPSG